MRAYRRTLFLSTLNMFVLCSFVPYKDKHYVDYFLHRHSADLFRDKQFNLVSLKVDYGWKVISRIYIKFSCFRSLSLKEARILLIETADNLLAKINNDPMLREKEMLLGGHFCTKQLYLTIEAGNVFAECCDDSTSIHQMALEDGMITYETYRSSPSPYMSVGKKKFKESYRDALLLVKRDAGKGIGFEIEDELERTLEDASIRKAENLKKIEEKNKQREQEQKQEQALQERIRVHAIESVNNLVGLRPLEPRSVIIEQLNFLVVPKKEETLPLKEDSKEELPPEKNSEAEKGIELQEGAEEKKETLIKEILPPQAAETYLPKLDLNSEPNLESKSLPDSENKQESQQELKEVQSQEQKSEEIAPHSEEQNPAQLLPDSLEKYLKKDNQTEIPLSKEESSENVPEDVVSIDTPENNERHAPSVNAEFLKRLLSEVWKKEAQSVASQMQNTSEKNIAQESVKEVEAKNIQVDELQKSNQNLNESLQKDVPQQLQDLNNSLENLPQQEQKQQDQQSEKQAQPSEESENVIYSVVGDEFSSIDRFETKENTSSLQSDESASFWKRVNAYVFGGKQETVNKQNPQDQAAEDFIAEAELEETAVIVDDVQVENEAAQEEGSGNESEKQGTVSFWQRINSYFTKEEKQGQVSCALEPFAKEIENQKDTKNAENNGINTEVQNVQEITASGGKEPGKQSEEDPSLQLDVEMWKKIASFELERQSEIENNKESDADSESEISAKETSEIDQNEQITETSLDQENDFFDLDDALADQSNSALEEQESDEDLERLSNNDKDSGDDEKIGDEISDDEEIDDEQEEVEEDFRGPPYLNASLDDDEEDDDEEDEDQEEDDQEEDDQMSEEEEE